MEAGLESANRRELMSGTVRMSGVSFSRHLVIEALYAWASQVRPEEVYLWEPSRVEAVARMLHQRPNAR